MNVYESPGGDEFFGSNVELGTLDDVYQELKLRAEQIDPALQEFRDADRKRSAAYDLYKRSWSLDLLTNRDGRITARKAEAEARNISLKIDLEEADKAREVAIEVLQARRDQLSAAQTRANVLRMQARIDMGTGPK